MTYPMKVDYCGICSLPPEYCENGPLFEKCKEWMEDNLPDHYARLILNKTQEELEAMTLGNGKKKQTRGGKAMKNLTKKQDVQKQVAVGRSMRARKKYVTLIRGLKTCDMNLKKCSKAFGQKFACGSSVTGDDEITVQGDVIDDIMDFIAEELGIDADLVVDVGDIKD
eukprot:sb/3472333/